MNVLIPYLVPMWLQHDLTWPQAVSTVPLDTLALVSGDPMI